MYKELGLEVSVQLYYGLGVLPGQTPRSAKVACLVTQTGWTHNIASRLTLFMHNHLFRNSLLALSIKKNLLSASFLDDFSLLFPSVC